MLAILIVALAGSALAGPCVRTYTVAPGDICDSISAAKNVSTYQLATISEGVINSACGNLVPGKSICLGYENEDCTQTHVVTPNETCEIIQSVAGINSTLLWGNNPQIDAKCSNIYIGEVLCVAKTIVVPPANGKVASTAVPSTAVVANTIATTTYSTAAPSATADNDEDLPWCDEL